MRRPRLVLLLVLAGCAGAEKRDPIPPDQLRADRERFLAEVARDNAENARTFLRRLAAKLKAAGDGPLVIDMLALSGGGPNGAFGTGFLRGWGEAVDAEARRPAFDLVTGISTGAIIAPFAFSGTDARIVEIDELYRNPKDDWTKKRSGALLFGGPSLLEGDGLWRDLRDRVQGDLVREVSQGRREHRMMLIGTIDADLGLQRVWNGAEIAQAAEASGDAADLHRVIIASASYPGAFPAVEIDGHLHVDGGMGALFIAGIDGLWLERAVEAWRAYVGDTKAPPRLRIWIIVNNRLQVPATTTQPTWLGTMGRGMDVGSRIASQVLVGSYIRAAETAGTRTGWPIEVRYVAIPDRAALPESHAPFDPTYMRALSDLGRAMGRDPASWQTDVPRTEWPRDVELQPE